MDQPPSKKGVSIVAARDYVLAKAGHDAWASVLGVLTADDADTISAAVETGWYPLDLHARLLRAVDTGLGDGDSSTISPIARFEAERDVPAVHHLLLRMGNPAEVAEKMAELWPRSHSTGRLRIERRDDRGIDATLVDWATDEALCLAFQAYFQRALELAGARDTRIAHSTCRAHGAAECSFKMTWSAEDG